MSGVREEILDRRADVLGLPVVKVMIPSACPKLYEQWMASVLATAPGAGSPRGALLWGRPARSWPGDRFVNHDVIPARDAGWTRLEAPSGTGNSKRRGSVGGSSSLASGSITADQASSHWQRLGKRHTRIATLRLGCLQTSCKHPAIKLLGPRNGCRPIVPDLALRCSYAVTFASACFAWSSRLSGLEAPDTGDSVDPAIEGGDHADPRNLGGRAKVRIGKIEPFGLVMLDGPQQQLVIGRHGRESQQSPGGVAHLIARSLVVGLQDVDQLSSSPASRAVALRAWAGGSPVR